MHPRTLLSQRRKAQSAMEYLMTYGWAILIIAVVLGALFELGVFSGTFFMPHVPPGSCHVFRPYGPGTVGSINLEGECQGALPQYALSEVSYDPAYGCVTNPDAVYVTNVFMADTYNVTITGWFNPRAYPWSVIWHLDSSNPTPGGAGTYCGPSGCNVPDKGINSPTLPIGAWSFFAERFNKTSASLFENGYEVASSSWNGPFIGISDFNIGSYEPQCADEFNGTISNVQLYNGSLSANDILSLYQEGIGGAPMNLQNLVGWWPLNGNANDYSGNNYNGKTASNDIYLSDWESGYTQP